MPFILLDVKKCPLQTGTVLRRRAAVLSELDLQAAEHDVYWLDAFVGDWTASIDQLDIELMMPVAEINLDPGVLEVLGQADAPHVRVAALQFGGVCNRTEHHDRGRRGRP